MHFSSSISLLLLAVSTASAATFNGFPSPSLTCKIIGGTSTWTLAELKAIATAGLKQGPFESSAANIASGKCSSSTLPYYIADLGKNSGTLSYTYDKKKDSYTFCMAQTADLDGDGYRDACA